jgi:hypothetical protein
MKNHNFKDINLVLFLVIWLITGCNGLKNENCDLVLDDVKSTIYDYYTNANDETLYQSLSKIKKCEVTPELIHTKVELYRLLKDCQTGLEYTTELSKSNLKYAYEKVLFTNLFRVCLDSANIIDYWLETQKSIVSELNKNHDKAEIWYSYINVSSQIIDKKDLKSQIDIATDTLTNTELIRLIRDYTDF